MSKVKNLKVKNILYTIRDANTLLSLSSSQKTKLLQDGTYNDESVQNGTIFNSEDGSFQQFDKESQGIQLKSTTYTEKFMCCNTCVTENGNNKILYAVPNGYYYSDTDRKVATKLYRSEDAGEHWTLIDSNRSTSGFSNYQSATQVMYYLNNTYYILTQTYSGGYYVFLDISSDLINWERITIYSGGASYFNYPSKTQIILHNDKLFIQNTENGNGLFKVWNDNGWYVRQLYCAGKIYSFDNKLITNSSYSTDEGETWQNSDSYFPGASFIKDGKFYTQSRPSFSSIASLQVTTNGVNYTNVGQYEDIGISNLYFNDIFTYEETNTLFAECNGNIFYADYVEGVLKWSLIGENFYSGLDRCSGICVSQKIFFLRGSGPDNVRGEYDEDFTYSLIPLSYTKSQIDNIRPTITYWVDD